MRVRQGQRGKKLQLHRETVRVLSARSLANAAGGSQVIGTETVEGKPQIITAPKTNIWTGGGDTEGYEPARFCAGVIAG
jgi:hypothetical protein